MLETNLDYNSQINYNFLLMIKIILDLNYFLFIRQ